jgi:hypothetical protein
MFLILFPHLGHLYVTVANEQQILSILSVSLPASQSQKLFLK